MLSNRPKNQEIKYLDKYVWLWGRWWERNIDFNGSRIESMRPVPDDELDTIPPRYFEYYNELAATAN